MTLVPHPRPCKVWQTMYPEQVGSIVNPESEKTRHVRLMKLRNPKCKACPLHATEGNVCVMGRGRADSPLMFIGEAPGRIEAATGKPLMGEAGRLLQKHIDALGLRDYSYVTNTCRCRPPHDREPTPEERWKCSDLYLWREIGLVDPLVIVLLGTVATWAFDPIPIPRKHRGYLVDVGQRSYVVIPTWHPSYCLKAGKTVEKQMIASLQLAKEFLTHGQRI